MASVSAHAAFVGLALASISPAPEREEFAPADAAQVQIVLEEAASEAPPPVKPLPPPPQPVENEEPVGPGEEPRPAPPAPRETEGERKAVAPPDAAPPKKADRVAPTPAPETDAIARSDAPVPSRRPSDAPTNRPEALPLPPAAPEEATTKIVTEADETSDEMKPTPVETALPAGRPAEPERPSEPEAASEDAPEQAPSRPDAERPAAPEPAQSTALTRIQLVGIMRHIQPYWREDRVRHLPRYEELKVVMRARLDRSGRIVGDPEVISPRTWTDERWRIAIDAARIAMLRAGQEGFDLPPESWDRWQVIEVAFNPGEGVSF